MNENETKKTTISLCIIIYISGREEQTGKTEKKLFNKEQLEITEND